MKSAKSTEAILSGWTKIRLLFTLCFLSLLLQLVTVNSYAQFTKLLDFGNVDNGTRPYSALISDGTFLYGMTSDGGANHLGTIYKVKPDGTGFAKLLDFDDANGSNPYGSLTSDGTFLYGMTRGGGANGQGTVFRIKPDGTGFTDLLDFSYFATGAYPYGSLISDGTFLYGMTTQGGSNFYGTIFKIMPDGTGYAKLFEFDYTTTGGNPYGSLFSDGTFLYGMTTYGGTNDLGTAFKIKPDGTGFIKLLDFNGTATGSSPYGSLISDGAFLYGMTFYGGSNNYGTIFKIMPDGTGFAKLLDFNRTTNGAYPKGSLISDGTFLYGMTSQGGSNSLGTIFKIKPDGTGYVKLQDSNDNSSGPAAEGTLLIDGTALYGVKSNGGPGNLGTVFKINNDGSGYSRLVNFEIAGNSPSGSLISEGAFLYGMTSKGGLYNNGTIFKIKPDGTGFVRLLDFDGTNGRTPNGSLVSDGTFLYGMTYTGGLNEQGIIFKIKFDGTGFTKLFDFNFATSGGYPNGSLFSDGTFLYGMTYNGGPGGSGTIFKIKTDGTGFTNLLNFNTTNGGYPNGSLISDGTFLYGMTSGSTAYGAIVKIKADGTGFAKLFDFDYTNGGTPYGSLFSDGAFLYGMTSIGGLNNYGTIFKIKDDGTGFSTLLDFDGDINGSSPRGSFVSDGTFLYGMTPGGGILGSGTIFKIKPDGTGYAKLLDFTTPKGSYPNGSLISDGTFLYGMTGTGGANSLGTLFKRSLAPSTIITNFIPAEGVEGTLVTINGVDFDPTAANNMVDFNGTPATVTSSTATTLTVIVPVGAASGPISVTAIGTDTSLTDFTVTTEAVMVNGSVQNCDVTFVGPTYQYVQDNGYNDIIETFLPINPSYKVNVSFSSIDLQSDALYVYDGPTPASPLIATLQDTNLPTDIIATGPGGELTFVYVWGDGTTDWDATISCQSSSTIKACDVPFLDPGGNSDYLSDQNLIQTFSPVNSSDKIRVSFSSFSTEDGYDSLSVYDGPSSSSPLVAVLSGDISPSDITATGPGGELTFAFRSDGGVESTGWEAFITCIGSTPPPTITTFSPGSGLVGTTVTITGTNFNLIASNNIVAFNGTLATVTASTLTSITVNVPTGATTGPISVTVGSNTATSTTNFCVLPSTDMITITASGTELIASSGDSYQWYNFNSAISGATAQSFEYSVLEYGEYAVDVTINGCANRSEDFIYLVTGQETSQHGVKVYPNPTHEKLFVELPDNASLLKITDPLGRILLEKQPKTGITELDTRSFAQGMYYLIIKSHDDVMVFKIQKL